MKICLFILAISFALSGFCALLYEVLWVRLITLFCGHTTLAVSAVIAAFMAGLALGSTLGGWVADRRSPAQLLKLYGLAELSIGLCGCLSEPTLNSLQNLLAPKLFELSFAIQALALFTSAFSALLVPTTCMGATLPFLTATLSKAGLNPSQDLGPNIEPSDKPLSLLYGINTLGAFLGVLAAGFVLIPHLGLKTSLILAGGLNGLVAMAAFFLANIVSAIKGLARVGGGSAGNKLLQTFKRPGLSLAALALGLAGASSMICEVAWTRAFALILGSSTYAFTIMLATFLLGLAAGSLAFRILRLWFRPTLQGWGLILASIALSVFLFLPFFDKLPYVIVRIFPYLSLNPYALHGLQFTLCAGIIFLPTFLMGAAFPWGLATLKPNALSIGSETGLCYAANTLGAIMGSAAAGLFFIPTLGVERTLLIAAWIYAGTAILIWLGSGPKPWTVVLCLALTCCLAFGSYLRPAWSQRIMSSGLYLYAPYYQDLPDYSSFMERLNRDKVLFYKDGLSASVAVLESRWGERYLRLNGKTDASQGGDLATQLLLGYLPLLLHPKEPQSALIIGLGSGVTAAALATSPRLAKLDVVEIEPSVVEAAAWFDQANREILKDPRLRLILADARQILTITKNRYDLIISEPSNPWIAGVANLFTQEAFESAKSRLSENGVFCQWFHSYFMGEEDFRMVLNTFASVFPHVLLMSTGDADFFLMGSKSPWGLDYKKILREFKYNPNLKLDLARTGLGIEHPLTFLAATFLLEDKEFRNFAKNAPIHKDDRPSLEFSAPRHLHRLGARPILKKLLAQKNSLLPESIQGLTVPTQDWSLLYNLAGEAFFRTQDLEQALYALNKALSFDSKSSRLWANLGLVYEAKNELMQAERAYRNALALDSNSARPKSLLGALYIQRGQEEKGQRLLEEALKSFPAEPIASLHLARIHSKRGRIQDALQTLRLALTQPIADAELRRSLMEDFQTLEH